MPRALHFLFRQVIHDNKRVCEVEYKHEDLVYSVYVLRPPTTREIKDDMFDSSEYEQCKTRKKMRIY